jgi:invasion protein IalB
MTFFSKRMSGVAAAAFAALLAMSVSESMAQTKPAAPAAPAKPGAAAPAGDPKAADQSAWVKLCEKAPSLADDKKELNVCLTHHERIDGNTGLVLVSAALRKVEGQDKEALMIMVPLGMALPPGAQVKIDENEPIKLAFTLCHAAGCTAETEASKDIVAKMKAGKQMIVAAINLAGKPIGFPVPLTGFGPAYDGAPVDNDKYKEARGKLMEAIRDRQVELIKKAQEEQAKNPKAADPKAAAPAPKK